MIVIVASVATISGGRWFVGSFEQTLPPSVPRFRTCTSAIVDATSARIGRRSATSRDERMSASVAIAPSSSVPSPVALMTVSSSSAARSTSMSGAAARCFITLISVCPPASARALSCSDRSWIASAIPAGRAYSTSLRSTTGLKHAAPTGATPARAGKAATCPPPRSGCERWPQRLRRLPKRAPPRSPRRASRAHRPSARSTGASRAARSLRRAPLYGAQPARANDPSSTPKACSSFGQGSLTTLPKHRVQHDYGSDREHEEDDQSPRRNRSAYSRPPRLRWAPTGRLGHSSRMPTAPRINHGVARYAQAAARFRHCKYGDPVRYSVNRGITQASLGSRGRGRVRTPVRRHIRRREPPPETSATAREKQLPSGLRQRGLIYHGLVRAKSGPCRHVFVMRTKRAPPACTHGPDPAR